MGHVFMYAVGESQHILVRTYSVRVSYRVASIVASKSCTCTVPDLCNPGCITGSTLQRIRYTVASARRVLQRKAGTHPAPLVQKRCKSWCQRIYATHELHGLLHFSYNPCNSCNSMQPCRMYWGLRAPTVRTAGAPPAAPASH